MAMVQFNPTFRRLFSRVPLRMVLILPFIAQVFLVVGLTSWLSISNGQHAVNDVASQLRQEVSLRVDQKLHEFFAIPPLVNKINQSQVQLGHLDLQNPEKLQRYFFQQAKDFDVIDSIFFGNANGEFVGIGHFNHYQYQLMRGGPSLNGAIQFSDLDPNGQVLQPHTPVPGWTTQTRPWYRAAVEAGKPVWGEIFPYHAYPVMAIPASAPIYDRTGHLIGVLGNNFFLSQVGEFLSHLAIKDKGQIFIIERSGLLVASSNLVHPFTIVDGKPQRIDAITSDNPLIRATSQFLLRHFNGELGRIQTPTQMNFKLNRQRQFLQVAPFEDGQGLNWLIVVVVPEQAFMGQIQANTRHTIVLSGLALLGAIGLGWITSRWITQPIQQFSLASQAIARGHLGQQITQTGLRELETLAIAFNSMANRLEGSFTDLRRSQSELQQANTELQRQASLFRLIAENMSDLVALHAPNGQFRYVSPSAQWLLGYRPTQLEGQNLCQLVHPDDGKRVREELEQTVSSGLPSAMTYRVRHQSGQYLWLETMTRPILDQAGAVVQLQSASRDVTETIRMRKQLEHDALHDALTGLPNRNLLINRLELALNRCHRHPDYCFAVLFLDLDRFKIVNDSLGHLVGDELLMETSQRLKQLVRSIDLAVRLGGDEFVVLLDEIADIADAVHITERILQVLRQPLTVGDQDMFPTVSIGVVLGQPHYQQASDLIRDADIAMYRAKARGRDRYEIFDQTMHDQVIHQLQMENDLRRALLDHPEAFVLYYQPIVDLVNGVVKGFEALVRWQHPQKGLLPPSEFISLAEETGLIVPLSRWLMELACEQLKTWQRIYPHAAELKVSVNLSAAQLHQGSLIEQIDRILLETGLPPQNLVLEITESMLVEHIDLSLSIFQALRERSIAISIDDFGTGYSSLSYLSQFPVQTLKIDRSFVTQMLVSHHNRRIVDTIITLARQLDFQTVAEGIETQEQLNTLKMLRCDYGQGYWFSRPMSPVAVEAWLQQAVPYFQRTTS